MDYNPGGKATKAKNCAECRRLKIKCDRTVPCSNCVKQGKIALCPDGTLLPKGTRVILSSATAEDLPKIEQLLARIKELEEALSHLQAMHSTEPHPLLVSKSPQRSPSPGVNKPKEEEEDATVHGIGSLMIGEGGNVRFFGSTSSIEWTVVENGPGLHLSSAAYPSSPLQDTESHLHSTYDGTVDHVPPIPPLPLLPFEDDVADMSLWKQRVIHGLPERELATKLVGSYYSRAAWEICPVRRTDFVQEYFGPCYERPENPPITMHQLAFIYIIFSLGALHAHDIPSNEGLARQYMTFSQACLRIDDCLRNTNLNVVNTLLLQIAYYYSCDDTFYSGPSSAAAKNSSPYGPYPISPARGHVLLGITMKLAGAIGLHREPSMWGLPAQEVARRRRTMWELINMDLWVSLVSGRPPSFAKQHLDVNLPIENPEVSDPDPTYDVGKFHFANACLWDIVNLGLASPKTTSYAAVLQVDKKIRQWRLPDSLVLRSYEPSEQQKTMMMFKNTMGMIFREITFLCLHRCYFASALLSPTFDLITSPYSRSVLAAYASSCTILSRVRALYAAEPVAIMRFSLFWTHAFSSAVILGAISIRAPDCSLAAVALTELEMAVEMFEKAQAGYRARRGLPTLLHLQDSARASMREYRNGTWVRNAQADSKLLRNMVGLGAVVQEPASSPSPSSSSQQQTQGYVSMSASRAQHQPTVSTSPASFSSPPPPSTSSLPPLSHSVNPPISESVSHPPGISASLDEFLRTFDFGASQISLGGDAIGGTGTGGVEVARQTYVPTSDQFLNSVMTGNWGQSLFPPSPLINTDRLTTAAPTAGLPGVPNMYQDFNLYSHDSSSSPAQHPTPPSDGGSSYHDGSIGVNFSNNMGGGGGVEPPPSMLSPFMVPSGGGRGGEYSMEEELRKSLVWDNFLKELGIQGAV